MKLREVRTYIDAFSSLYAGHKLCYLGESHVTWLSFRPKIK